jgi:hypothetical protein
MRDSRRQSRRRQPRPYHPARQAKVIQPRHVVGVESGGQNFRLPRADRRFEALQLTDHRIERIGAFAALVGQQVLPAKQEAHEILRADGLDFLPQPLHGVTMDARQQCAVAPLLRRRSGRERTRHRNTLRCQHS